MSPCRTRAPRRRLTLALLFVITAISGCSSGITSERATNGSSVIGAAPGATTVPANSKLQVAPEDALGLWKRTLLAARTSAGVSEVVETRFGGAGGDHDAVRFEVVESEGRQRGQVARYRLTYTAPDAIKGVVILNDGRHVWRYNAHKRLIARQASITAPIPPELEEGVAAAPIQADGARPEIEAGPERVAGRITQVLALRTRRAGRIVERRWVDGETGRTMRLEQYAGRDAHIVRRIEIAAFRPLKSPADLAWAANQFAPSFPNSARVVESGTSHTRHLAEAEDVARHVQLPLHVRGFALRSVERISTTSPVASQMKLAPTSDCGGGTGNCGGGAAAPPGKNTGTTQLYYSKGNQAISIFVSENPGSSAGAGTASNQSRAATALIGREGWTPTTLAIGRLGFVNVASKGSAVAWSGGSGNSYIAVTHMQLAEFLPLVRAFVADRDDAPSAGATGR